MADSPGLRSTNTNHHQLPFTFETATRTKMSSLRKNARRVLVDKMNMTLTEIADADKNNKGRTADEASTAAVSVNSRGRARKRASSEPPTSSRLLLSNLEKGVTDQDLEELLEAVGKLKLVALCIVKS